MLALDGEMAKAHVCQAVRGVTNLVADQIAAHLELLHGRALGVVARQDRGHRCLILNVCPTVGMIEKWGHGRFTPVGSLGVKRAAALSQRTAGRHCHGRRRPSRNAQGMHVTL